MYNCLWQEPEEEESIRRIIIRSLFSDCSARLADMKLALEADIRVTRQHRAMAKARQQMEVFDSNKKIYDTYYYHLEKHDTGNTYIFITDYQNMRKATKENAGQLGVIYRDPKKPERSIIRCYDGTDYPKGARQVYLTRDEEGIYIDGVYFKIEKLDKGESQAMFQERGKVSERDFYQEIEHLGSDIMLRKEQILSNILISQKDKQVITEIINTLMKEVAYTRQDIEKLEA